MTTSTLRYLILLDTTFFFTLRNVFIALTCFYDFFLAGFRTGRSLFGFSLRRKIVDLLTCCSIYTVLGAMNWNSIVQIDHDIHYTEDSIEHTYVILRDMRHD